MASRFVFPLFLALVLSSPSHAYAGITVSELTEREYLLTIIAERDRLYQQRFDAQERAVASALAAAKEAVSKAEIASEKRFDAINEFRGQMRDQEHGFLTTKQYEAQHEALKNVVNDLAKRIEIVSQRQYQSQGNSEGANSLWLIIAGIAGLAVGIAAIIVNLFRHRQPQL